MPLNRIGAGCSSARNKLDAYLQQGLTNSSRQVISETLNVMGLNWMLQTAQAEQMLAAQLGMLPQYFHRLGRMAQEAGRGYYVDVYMQLTGEYPSGGDDAAHVQIVATSNLICGRFLPARWNTASSSNCKTPIWWPPRP